MKTICLLFTATALSLCLMCAPVGALAKDKDKEKEKEKAKPAAAAAGAQPEVSNAPAPAAPVSKAEFPQQAWPADFQRLLANPPLDMQLFSLEPMESAESGEETLQGFKVLGKMFMRPETAHTAVAAFNEAIEKWDCKKAKCFKPRQALVVKDGGHLYEILLCYSCQQMFAYRDGVQVRSYGVTGSPKILKDILRKADKPLSTTDPKT